MRRLPLILALLVSLLLIAAYTTLGNQTETSTAQPVAPDGAIEATTSTPRSTAVVSVVEPTAAPFNAAENSLDGAVTSTTVAAGEKSGVEAADEGVVTAGEKSGAEAADEGVAAAEKSGAEAAAEGVVAADDPLISYTGRFDFSEPGIARFDWPGTTIEAAFSGTSITVLLDPGDNHFNVVVDGATQYITPGENSYRFRVDPGPARHTIRLTKRTEAYAGMVTFHGFLLEPGQRLLPPPARAERRIEFLGDSITTGYGAAGESAACSFSRATQDVQLTYAALAADAFDADYSVIAMSGLGAVRNFKAETPTSAQPLAAFYPRTLALNPDLRWSFSSWPADAVVIYLGTNDFSTTPWPSQTAFVDGYVAMMGTIRDHYPQAHIFAMGGPLLFGPGEQYVQDAVRQMREQQGDQRVHFVPFSGKLGATDFGCDHHPNAAGHRRIAQQLIPVMAAALDW